MAQTLGALQISKCATSCLHEQTSTLKKEDCPETQSTKSTKNTSLEPPSPTFIFWACKQKYGFLRHSVNQVGTLFTHAMLPFPPFPSFSFNWIYRTFHHGTVSGSWFWMENALNKIAWSGKVAGSVSSVPLPLTVAPLASQVVDWSCWLVGWLVGWLRNTITIHALGDGQDSWNECYLCSHNYCVAKQTLAAISSQLRAHLFNHVGFGGISSCPSQTPWWMDGRKRSAGMSTSSSSFFFCQSTMKLYTVVYDYDFQP